jgi:hypothetical protein
MDYKPQILSKLSLFIILFFAIIQLNAQEYDCDYTPLTLDNWNDYELYKHCIEKHMLRVDTLRKKYDNLIKCNKVDTITDMKKKEIYGVLLFSYNDLISEFKKDEDYFESEKLKYDDLLKSLKECSK